MNIDFINILLWVVHNNKGIKAPSTIVSSSVVTSPTPHSLPSVQEPSVYESPTQFTLVPPQLTVRPSDSCLVDSNLVDSSLPFRTSKLDSSSQTRLSPETFSSLGSQSAISRLVKVANDCHESKINVDLNMETSDLAQKVFVEMFERETISNGLFDLALLITFELVRNENLIDLPFDPGGPYQSTLSLRTRTIPRGRY
ncbi:hypothetical protein Dimus_039050 [Dionaea muscipula]